MKARPSPRIPELPKAADMLERVRAEAAELRNFTITFMSLLLYVAIIIASTTHEQILRIDPVKLPLLGVDIPIVGFYWFMPGFLFFLHMYILLQHYLFSQLAFRFRAALERETDEETQNHLRRSLGNLPFLHWLAGQQSGFMNFLMTAITVVSLIIWPVFTFWWLQAAFLPYHDKTIVWTQRWFLFFDVALLAYMWAKILDDQDNTGRWWKPWLAPFFYGLVKPVKAVVRRVIDWLSRQPRLAIGLRRLCRRSIIDWIRLWLGDAAGTPIARVNTITLAAVFDRWLLSAFLIIALFFSFVVSTIPDSDEEKWLLARLPDTDFWISKPREQENRHVFVLTALVHEQLRKSMDDIALNDYDLGRIRECSESGTSDKPDKAADGKSINDKPDVKPEAIQKCYWIDSPFPRNLILREKLLIANKGLAAEVQAGLSLKVYSSKTDDLAKAEGLSLQGRYLEYADFSQSSLPNADLRRARLKAANFLKAKLENTNLEHAQLLGANLYWAQLTGADLSLAQLTGADLSLAQLPGANLSRAKLFGANLFGAQLSRANLFKAKLSGAHLFGTQLRDASLIQAELIGAYLSDTQLSGADLSLAQLTGADLSRVQLPGANLSMTRLSGTLLEHINFAPMEKEVAIANADFLLRALKDLPWYLGVSGQATLAEEINKYRQKITRTVDFSRLAASESCLADKSALKKLPPCKKIGDPEAQKSAYGIWVNLACHDNTEKHWIAQRMIDRAVYSRFPDFAPLLAAKLQIPDKCPGLANLDDETKKTLLDAAKKTP